MCEPHACLVPTEATSCWVLQKRSYRHCELPGVNAENTHDPLQEQQVTATTKPSNQASGAHILKILLRRIYSWNLVNMTEHNLNQDKEPQIPQTLPPENK